MADRTTHLATQWLQSKEACEKAGYDGSVEYAKEFIELAEPELLACFKDIAEIRTYAESLRIAL